MSASGTFTWGNGRIAFLSAVVGVMVFSLLDSFRIFLGWRVQYVGSNECTVVLQKERGATPRNAVDFFYLKRLPYA